MDKNLINDVNDGNDCLEVKYFLEPIINQCK